MSGSSSNTDYYKILGVSSEASVDEIKKSYRKLALQYHPDRQKADSDKSQAEARFKEISEAYEVLSDTQQRQRYDLTRGLGAGGMGGMGGSGMGGMGSFSFNAHNPMDIFNQFFGENGSHSGGGFRNTTSFTTSSSFGGGVNFSMSSNIINNSRMTTNVVSTQTSTQTVNGQTIRTETVTQNGQTTTKKWINGVLQEDVNNGDTKKISS